MNEKFLSSSMRGFSLVESLLVLTILGVLLIIGIPQARVLYYRTKLDTTGRVVMASLMKARYLAVTRNTYYYVRFQPVAGNWTITPSPDLLDHPPVDPLGPVQYLPAGITFRSDGVSGPPSDPRNPSPNPVSFPQYQLITHPDGCWSGFGTLYLGNEIGDRIAITVNVAGRIRLYQWNPDRRRWTVSG